MEKNKKIIIVAAILVVAILVYMFWPNIKAMFAKKEQPDMNNNANNSTTTTNTTTTPTIKPIRVNDSVLAAKDLVKAFDEELNSVVRTYKKGEYIGVVRKNENNWLTIMDTAGNLKQVQKSNVKRM